MRFGYSPDYLWNWDVAVTVTGNSAPVSVSVQTTTVENAMEGVPVPSPSRDQTFRLVCGLEAFGRDALVTVRPRSADSQWTLQSLSITGTASLAGIEDS